MGDLFDDVGPDDEPTLDAQVARELPNHGAMPYRSISRGWQQDRSSYELSLPGEGWFVAITGAYSLAAASAALGPSLLAEYDIDRLTLSEVTSSSEHMKSLTTGIATWIRDRVTLEDGSRPHGIVYPSKWGTSFENWAMWMRRADDGTGGDPVVILETTTIGRLNRPFVQAAKLRGMRIYDA
jgi:hypothetical protein